MSEHDEHAQRFREAVHGMAKGIEAEQVSAPKSPSEGVEAKSLMKRYWDAYLIARVTVGFGDIIKTMGIVLAVLVALGALLIASQIGGGGGFATFIIGILLASFVGALFYLLGIIVAAQGEILKASLDGAVNSSPFLTNEHRAKIMSLK